MKQRRRKRLISFTQLSIRTEANIKIKAMKLQLKKPRKQPNKFFFLNQCQIGRHKLSSIPNEKFSALEKKISLHSKKSSFSLYAISSQSKERIINVIYIQAAFLFCASAFNNWLCSFQITIWRMVYGSELIDKNERSSSIVVL